MYLEKRVVLHISKELNFSKSSGYDWAQMTRDVSVHEISDLVEGQHILSGVVEVDESLFGYHRKHNKAYKPFVLPQTFKK